jgi:general L-amino acid transport system permease protein
MSMSPATPRSWCSCSSGTRRVSYGLPRSSAAFNPLPGIFLTDRGLYLPQPVLAGHGGLFLAVLAIIAAALWVARRRGWSWLLTATVAVLASIVAFRMCGLSITLQEPVLGRFNFMGGMTLTPEFVAVALGLTLYSTAFTAEIIRGGIDAVGRGQWEAAQALGLGERDLMRRIVLPQALRVIIPPMASQYINIVKNSTLGLVVGYPELNFVTATTINQTGQAIEGIVVLMAIFLTISIGTSLLLDCYNRHVALVER